MLYKYRRIGTNQSPHLSCTFTAKLMTGKTVTVFRPREAVLSVALYLLLGAIFTCFCRGGADFHSLVWLMQAIFGSILVYAGLTSYLIHQNSGYIRIFLQPLG